ncbi:MAG: 5-(carboxyamino)imidazole ribonucleotide mutase [Candidatus Omnitrophota bacterium]
MKVSILMGSPSDLPKMKGAAIALKQFGVAWEARVMSAHRSPAVVESYVREAPKNGVRIFICGAGLAAHLAGCVAGQTHLPVIGVPLSSGGLNGQDALFSTVQMPKGVPVATVAIDGAFNAGLLAVQMLALSDEKLTAELLAWKKSQEEAVLEADKKAQETIAETF